MVKVHDQFEEVLVVDDVFFNVALVHRDWNPPEGMVGPEGTVWTGVSEVLGKQIVGAAKSKHGALLSLRKQIRFNTLYADLIGIPGLSDALTAAHKDVEDTIEVWHVGETENGLTEFLCWTSLEYRRYVEDNIIPVRVVEKHLAS